LQILLSTIKQLGPTASGLVKSRRKLDDVNSLARFFQKATSKNVNFPFLLHRRLQKSPPTKCGNKNNRGAEKGRLDYLTEGQR